MIKNCLFCHNDFNTKRDGNRRKYCSKICSTKQNSLNITGIRRPDVAGEKNHFWKGGKIKTQCVRCNKIFERNQFSKQKFCSSKCYWIFLKLQFTNSGKGEYVWTKKSGEKIYEHRLVMEIFLRRKLLSSEIVHHKNHDRSDNRLENLEVMTQSQHIRQHFPYSRAEAIKKGREIKEVLVYE